MIVGSSRFQRGRSPCSGTGAGVRQQAIGETGVLTCRASCDSRAPASRAWASAGEGRPRVAERYLATAARCSSDHGPPWDAHRGPPDWADQVQLREWWAELFSSRSGMGGCCVPVPATLSQWLTYWPAGHPPSHRKVWRRAGFPFAGAPSPAAASLMPLDMPRRARARLAWKCKPASSSDALRGTELARRRIERVDLLPP